MTGLVGIAALQEIKLRVACCGFDVIRLSSPALSNQLLAVIPFKIGCTNCTKTHSYKAVNHWHPLAQTGFSRFPGVRLLPLRYCLGIADRPCQNCGIGRLIAVHDCVPHQFFDLTLRCLEILRISGMLAR